MKPVNYIALLGLGIVLGACAVALLRGPSANAQVATQQPTWVFQVGSSTLIPEAWKLNTRTGELQFCVHSTNPTVLFCERLPNPQ